MALDIPIFSSARFAFNAVHSLIASREIEKVSKDFKDVTCTFQSKMLEFRYFCDKEEEAIMLIVEDINEDERSLSILDSCPDSKAKGLCIEDLFKRIEENKDTLKEKLEAFDATAISMISYYLKEIESDVVKRFDGRENVLPRVTAKMIIGADENGKVLVDDVFRGNRSTEHHYWHSTFTADENSAFLNLINDLSQDCYLKEDIPGAIISNEYKNPRIDTEKAKKYYQRDRFDWKIWRNIGRETDHDWMDVWNNINSDVSLDERSCYKSTLVVPIGMEGNSLSSEVRSYLSGSDDFLIRGFLCLDHIYTDYFTKADISFAYSVADQFSVIWEDYQNMSNYFFALHLHYLSEDDVQSEN